MTISASQIASGNNARNTIARIWHRGNQDLNLHQEITSGNGRLINDTAFSSLNNPNEINYSLTQLITGGNATATNAVRLSQNTNTHERIVQGIDIASGSASNAVTEGYFDPRSGDYTQVALVGSGSASNSITRSAFSGSVRVDQLASGTTSARNDARLSGIRGSATVFQEAEGNGATNNLVITA